MRPLFQYHLHDLSTLIAEWEVAGYDVAEQLQD